MKSTEITRCLHSEPYLTVPAYIERIGESAFLNNLDLKRLTLPASMDSLGDGAFRNCENLRQIDLPKTVGEVGKGLFRECHVLEKVILPEGTRVVDRDMFVNCRELRELTIPKTVTQMDPNVFVWCRKLDVLRMEPWQMSFLVEVHRRTAILTYMSENDGCSEVDDDIRQRLEPILQIIINRNNRAALRYLIRRNLLDRSMAELYLENAALARRTEIAAMLLEYAHHGNSEDILDTDPFA